MGSQVMVFGVLETGLRLEGVWIVEPSFYPSLTEIVCGRHVDKMQLGPDASARTLSFEA